MANLKELRVRITSIGSTMKITSAMKMVSAAKLKKAQDAIVQMRPYASKLTEILQKASSTLDSSENAYGVVRDTNRTRVVVITSNRGLCGAFNSSVVKKTKALMADSNDDFSIVAIGKKAGDAFKDDARLVERNPELWDNIGFESASEYAQKLMDGYLAGEFDKVVLVYNAFRNAAVQEPTAEQMLPISMEVDGPVDTTEYLYEPTKSEILEDLIPTSLKTQFFASLLDANASEHGARMTAMHKATDNAKALQGDLKLEYNKARQAAITNEILEIVGGEDSLTVEIHDPSVTVSSITVISPATCSTSSDGVVEVIAQGDNGPFTYRIGISTQTAQSTGLFSQVQGGNNQIVVEDSAGTCIIDTIVNVPVRSSGITRYRIVCRALAVTEMETDTFI